jgi:acetyl/propionyl-CoA carboxylase alpha subunit
MNDQLKTLIIDDTRYETKHTKKFERRKQYAAPDPKKLLAFIPGVIVGIHVQAGQEVQRGDEVLVLEAMKMRNAVCALHDGRIKEVLVHSGERVQKHQLLVEFE